MIVLPVDLLNDQKKKSDPCVQNCCTLRVKEGCLLCRNFPRNLPQFFHNFWRLDLSPSPTTTAIPDAPLVYGATFSLFEKLIEGLVQTSGLQG